MHGANVALVPLVLCFTFILTDLLRNPDVLWSRSFWRLAIADSTPKESHSIRNQGNIAVCCILFLVIFRFTGYFDIIV